MRNVTVDTYRDDPLYPRIVRAVDRILRREKVVAPIDVLIGMGLLVPRHIEDWRFGRVPYLERVIDCNLTRLSRLLRILRFHAHDLKLVPSTAIYMRGGRGPKRRLRFTKAGDRKVEAAYSRHFVWPAKRPFHAPKNRQRGGARQVDDTHGSTEVPGSLDTRAVDVPHRDRIILFGRPLGEMMGPYRDIEGRT